jgi:hypothetical protein
VKSVQESEFGKLFEILHNATVIYTGPTAEKPSHMRPPQATVYRRMDVLLGIRVAAMVNAMMRCPLQHAHLPTRLGEKG